MSLAFPGTCSAVCSLLLLVVPGFAVGTGIYRHSVTEQSTDILPAFVQVPTPTLVLLNRRLWRSLDLFYLCYHLGLFEHYLLAHECDGIVLHALNKVVN
jgi:hypothetical protein